MSFLPQNYETPKSSNYYAKLIDGENRFRILSRPIMGWEDWENEPKKRPIRFPLDQKPLSPVDPAKPIKHFWSMIVWNYTEEQIQILHITQSSIRTAIEALCRDTDWGDPYAYDIKITRSGDGIDTKYVINPVPHKPTHDYIVEQYNLRPCHLDALFESADPFAKGLPVYTSGIFSK